MGKTSRYMHWVRVSSHMLVFTYRRLMRLHGAKACSVNVKKRGVRKV